MLHGALPSVAQKTLQWPTQWTHLLSTHHTLPGAMAGHASSRRSDALSLVKVRRPRWGQNLRISFWKAPGPGKRVDHFLFGTLRLHWFIDLENESIAQIADLDCSKNWQKKWFVGYVGYVGWRGWPIAGVSCVGTEIRSNWRQLTIYAGCGKVQQAWVCLLQLSVAHIGMSIADIFPCGATWYNYHIPGIWKAFITWMILFTIIHYYLIPFISIYSLKLLIIEIHSFQGVDLPYPASAPRHAAASGSRPSGHPDFQWPWPSCAVGLGFDLWSRWFFSLSANVLPLNLGVSLHKPFNFRDSEFRNIGTWSVLDLLPDDHIPVCNLGRSVLPSLIQETLVDGLFDFAVLPPIHKQMNMNWIGVFSPTFAKMSHKQLKDDDQWPPIFRKQVSLNRRPNPRRPSASCRHLWVPWPWPFCAPWPAWWHGILACHPMTRQVTWRMPSRSVGVIFFWFRMI